jgi:hypothetical protein
MAWQDEAIQTLRILINDLGEEATYTDGRLEQVLLVAAKMVKSEFVLATTYTISVSEVSISPDPIDELDDAFMNFMVLKAACIIDQSTFRTKALAAGIVAKCGPAMLDTVGHLDGFKQLLEIGPCASYEALKLQWTFGGGMTNVFRAILSPFRGNNFSPSDIYIYPERSRLSF